MVPAWILNLISKMLIIFLQGDPNPPPHSSERENHNVKNQLCSSQVAARGMEIWVQSKTRTQVLQRNWMDLKEDPILFRSHQNLQICSIRFELVTWHLNESDFFFSLSTPFKAIRGFPDNFPWQQRKVNRFASNESLLKEYWFFFFFPVCMSGTSDIY